MEAKSRTQYSARNTTVALVSRITAILMGYATRVVFTRMLSESYVGVNGLFTDILNVLALSELGIETAITYALYKPIAEEDKEKQKSIMRMYCWFYRGVAAVVALAGLAVIPFFDVLIKNKPDVGHLTFIYILYLANTVLSYLIIYKKTLIDAHQLSYIGTLYKTISWVIQDILQIGVLIITKNFILFLVVYILSTIVSNICISKKADKLYPYLREKNVQKLDTSERQSIFRNIRAMMMHKIGNVVVNNTDNLILSSFVGIVSVGCYSNYYLLIGSIRQVVDQVFQGITASVGNLGVTEKAFKVRNVFESTFFMVQWLYGISAIAVYELINPFVEISFGANYLFARDIVLVLCINFFVTGMRKATLVFRDSLGLFWYDRYKSVIEAVINLVVSIILVKQLGTIGVFLGTFISTILTSTWVEPYILYKHHLNCSSISYFVKYIIYTAIIGAIWLLTDKLCSYVVGTPAYTLLIRTFICIIIPNMILIAIYCRTKEFRFVFDKLKGLILRKKEGNR